MGQHSDWQIGVGLLANALAFMTLMAQMRENRKQDRERQMKLHEKNEARLQEVETGILKLDTTMEPIVGWFQRNVINGHGRH